MSDFFSVLIKVNIIFSVLFLVYYFFLRGNTFHNTNRFLLLLSLLLSVIIPHFEFAVPGIAFQEVEQNLWIFEEVKIPVFVHFENTLENSGWALDYSVLALWAYILVLMVFLLRFIFNIGSFFRLKKKFETVNNGDETLVLMNDALPPFSFFNWIFVPRKMYNDPGAQAIIEHEKAHSRHLHSLDLIAAELFTMINWFNPLAYLFKKSLKLLHEYIADEAVLNDNASKIRYLKLMVANTERYHFTGLSSNFYFSPIKNRILMLTKKKSPNTKRFLYLLFLPLIAFLMFACSQSGMDSVELPTKKSAHVNAQVVSLPGIPGTEPPSIRPIAFDGKVKKGSGYGWRVHPIKKTKQLHTGIDLKAPSGTEVYATSDGKVVKAKAEGDWGNLVIIRHDLTYETVYAHLKDFSVKKGDTVKKGQTIGHVGDTGASTAPHLHYEIRKDGESVDPEEYFGDGC